MEKDKLFVKIEDVVKEAFNNIENSKRIKNFYQDNNYDLNEDLNELRNILNQELKECYDNIEEKDLLNEVNDDDIVILSESDMQKYDIFVLVPRFNASAKIAEECIYSIIDNFKGLNYKIIIMTNKELDIFKTDIFLKVPHIIYKKNIFSLPEAYNCMVKYAKQYQKSEDAIISLMDDDAYILSGQNFKVKDCINKLEEYIAVSGHYYDISPVKSEFQIMINETHIQDFVSKYRKPYCHGGACFMIKLKNFPFDGLPIEGLGGISINILAINQAINSREKWYLYNDSSFQVFHPRKNNLFSWIATYLSYEIAWERALNMLDKENYNIWKDKLDETSENRVDGLYQRMLEEDNRVYALGNIFLTKFLKPLLKKQLQYTEFKKYKISTHINLK